MAERTLEEDLGDVPVNPDNQLVVSEFERQNMLPSRRRGSLCQTLTLLRNATGESVYGRLPALANCATTARVRSISASVL